MTSNEWATAISTVAASASAAFAGYQIWLSRRDANRRHAIDTLRRVGECLRPISVIDLDDVRNHILTVYAEGGTLSSNATRFFEFLDAIDLAAIALEGSVADGKLLRQHLRTVLRKEVVPISFIAALRTTCEDANIYEHLFRLVRSTRQVAAHHEKPR